MSQVSPHRIERLLREFSQVGHDPKTNGIQRVAYTKAEIEAKTLLIQKLRKLNAFVYWDSVGNIFGLLEPFDEGNEYLLVGSHLDTVKNGGRYDGTLGVIASLEMLRQVREGRVVPRLPLGLVCFACEEAARFGKATIGSRFFIGELSLEDFHEMREEMPLGRPAMSLADVIGRSSFHDAFSTVVQPTLFDIKHNEISSKIRVSAFLELHIEQGAKLEESGIPVGIVNGIVAPTRVRICLRTTPGHSGTTPMGRRTDLFQCAMAVWDEFRRYCESLNDEEFVWTLIGINTPSAQWGMIPGEIFLDVEVRSTKKTRKRRAIQRLRAIVQQKRKVFSIPVPKITEVYDGIPTRMAQRIQKTVRQAAKRCGVETRAMPSMAGHDAGVVARKWDAGLIFVPCKKGISHNPAESIRLDSVLPGFEVLLKTVESLGPADTAKHNYAPADKCEKKKEGDRRD